MKHKLTTILEQYAQYSVFIYILLLLIGGLLFTTAQWIAALKDSRNAWARVAEVEEIARHKDDSLDVYELNQAKIEVHDKRTWGVDTLEVSKDFEDSLRWIRFYYIRYHKPDTLDSLGGE